LTLRESLEYGDGGDPAQPPVMRAQQQAANRLGRLHRHFDEAGLLTIERYDFKGGIAEKSRRVLSDAQMLTGAPVDWEPPAPISLEAHAAALLDATAYETAQRQDALGRLARLTYPRNVTGAQPELRLRHNRAGALQSVALDGREMVRHIAYDARGQRTLVAYGNGLVTAFAHDRATSRLLRAWTGACAELGGGALGWRPQAPAAPLLDLGYTYDLVGNILRIADRTPGCGTLNGPAPSRDMLDRRFEYDALYRLRRATGREDTAIPVPRPWDDAPRIGYGSGQHGTPDQDNAPNLTRFYAESYRYDPAGNLLELRHESGGAAWVRRFGMGELSPDAWEAAIAPHLEGQAWPAAPSNRLTQVADGAALPAVTHRYDANGNLEEETGSRRFGWNWSDRLVSFREQAGAGPASLQAFYLYDAAGMRAKKLVRRQDGSLAVTVYVDGLFEHHMRVSPGGARRENNTLHVMDDASRVARIRVGQGFADEGRGFGEDASPALVYELADHLGSTTLSVDEAGAWVNREEFTPYGETSFGGYARKRYRFTGMERDEESGLLHMGARFLAPWLGRWSSADPTGPADGPNLYSYARNNPIGYRDPNGTQAKPAGADALDAGAPPPSAGQPKVDHMIPGGVASGPLGGRVPEYTADPDRIRNQDEALKGFAAGIVNTAIEHIGPAAAVRAVKREIGKPLPIIGPRLADLLFDPLEKRTEAWQDQYKLNVPDSEAAGGGYVAGIAVVGFAEALVASGISKGMASLLRSQHMGKSAAKMTYSHRFAEDEQRGIETFRREIRAGVGPQAAGEAAHKAAGAAGRGEGVDFHGRLPGVQEEWKFHDGFHDGPWATDQIYMDKASAQSFFYSQQFQLKTRAAGEQLVPLRMVKHFYVGHSRAVKGIGH
jgi:RHS repeat-associated protein